MAITGEVEVEAYHSLAVRDLQRGQAYGLSSGEALSRALGIKPLVADEIGLADLGWAGETPLWYYLLKEAEVRGGGERLGPLGGRIVAEVLLGIIDRDPESYRAVKPDWRAHAAGSPARLLQRHRPADRGGVDPHGAGGGPSNVTPRSFASSANTAGAGAAPPVARTTSWKNVSHPLGKTNPRCLAGAALTT